MPQVRGGTGARSWDPIKRPAGSLPPSKPPPARYRPGARSARRGHRSPVRSQAAEEALMSPCLRPPTCARARPALPDRPRRAFTLPELLVAVALAALLIGLLLSAV